MGFNLDGFVAEARRAAGADDPTKAMKALMDETFADPAILARAIPVSDDDDDRLLFEDDTVSVWWVRFPPDLTVPPHNHRTTAFIGVYQGAELNTFHRREDEGLVEVITKPVGPGEVLVLGPEGIHSVRAAGEEAALGLHVYLGPLTKIERSIFDPESGEELLYTDENYGRLTRKASDVRAYAGQSA